MEDSNSLAKHLLCYGIRPLYGDSYERWVSSVLTRKVIAKIGRYLEMDQPRYGSLEFLNYIGDPKIAGVWWSKKADAICASGDAIINRLPAGGKILDVGSGIGYLTTWYALQDSRQTVVGVDISPQTIRTARSYAEKLLIKNVKFECIDIAAYGSSDKYDVIIDTQSLYTIREIGKPLANLKNLLTSNGVIISIPALPTRAEEVEYLNAFNSAGLFLQSHDFVHHWDIEHMPCAFPLYVFSKDENKIDVDFDLMWNQMGDERQRRLDILIIESIRKKHKQESEKLGLRYIIEKYSNLNKEGVSRLLNRLDENEK